jgi:putative MATE family efflux protein
VFEIGNKAEKRSFYENILKLVLPLALQNLINAGINTADIVMLGGVGEIELSGVSLANQVFFVMTLFIFGLTSGAAVLTAQYWGKQDKKALEKVLGMTLGIAFVIGAIFETTSLVMPEQIIRIFTTEEAVIAQGIAYLRIIAFSYMISALTMSYLGVIRSMERVVISTAVYGISLALNVFLNYILIFGHLGFSAMGVRGAAIATLITRSIEFLLVIMYALFRNKDARIRLLYMFRWDRLLSRNFAALGMPVLLNELIWGVGFSTVAAIIGHVGSAMVAANSVVQVVRQLTTVISFGVASATAVVIGKTIGEGKIEHAKVYGTRFLRLNLLIGFCAGALILISIPIVVNNMVLTELAKKYLTMMMIVAGSYNVLGQALNVTLTVGILRGGGDTRFALIMEIVTFWGISILFGYISALVWHLPPLVFYIILTSDEAIKVPICYWRYRKYKWLRDVTR